MNLIESVKIFRQKHRALSSNLIASAECSTQWKLIFKNKYIKQNKFLDFDKTNEIKKIILIKYLF